VPALACSSCSAPLTLPPDLTALEATCAYCGTRTALPADVAQLRLQEQSQLVEQRQQAAMQAEFGAVAARTRSFALWIVILSVVVPLILTIAGFVAVWAISSHAVQHVPHHR
jgi:hypothetical protein